ncbi:putative RNA-directed DNA polymerase [Tanacetum coccineum]|uniref:RNA-directed DNA polymerase n=1 Tax=Tanacetum coccineum TaxID=301880 RepID=A0ABQ5G8Y8_9ASTR
MDGKVHTYKARLVVKGYTQTHEIDYEETFSLVAKIKSIRIMLAIAAFHDYEIWQMDVKTAFLNGKLIEDVFMAQPEGFENAKYPKRVCKLQKAIYGLKQASRSWNLCFHEKVTQFGFSRSEDKSIYMSKSVGVLGKCFAMKDLGDAAYILGIKIYRDRSKRIIGLSQDTYLDKILKRFKMDNSKKGNLPLHHGIKISSDLCPKTNDELDKMSRVPYASAIGSIMYAMTCTRPDVSFTLSMVSRHQQNPGEGSWFMVEKKELRLTGYCDAGWQTDKDDSRSQFGWIFLLNRGAVTWKSSKQDTVADSTCESEYIAACEASKEAIWMKNFIGDLGVVPTVQDPIEIFCDNESAVALTKEPKDHGKSKHIDRKYHFVRSKVAEGHVIVKEIRSEDNPADPFTKALANLSCIGTLGVRIAFSSVCGCELLEEDCCPDRISKLEDIVVADILSLPLEVLEVTSAKDQSYKIRFDLDKRHCKDIDNCIRFAHNHNVEVLELDFYEIGFKARAAVVLKLTQEIEKMLKDLGAFNGIALLNILVEAFTFRHMVFKRPLSRPRILVPFPFRDGDRTILVLAGDWYKRGHRRIRHILDMGRSISLLSGGVYAVFSRKSWVKSMFLCRKLYPQTTRSMDYIQLSDGIARNPGVAVGEIDSGI